MAEDDIEIESSPLCRKMEQNGIEVEIHIFRIQGSDEGWSLEVVDEESNSTVWDELFDTDHAALDELMRTIEEEGISVFLHPPDDQLH